MFDRRTRIADCAGSGCGHRRECGVTGRCIVAGNHAEEPVHAINTLIDRLRKDLPEPTTIRRDSTAIALP
ncbi:hypothetical protein ACWEO2_42290 [Nocardia sp. NPDC004278]